MSLYKRCSIKRATLGYDIPFYFVKYDNTFYTAGIVIAQVHALKQLLPSTLVL